jgi:ABC-type polysaccharide/polyol phosphate transport system ATPase subunit
MDNVIEVRHLSKRFKLDTGKQTLLKLFEIVATGKTYHKNIWALKNISFNKGEKIGLIGGNGSGKTTLLRIIAGIYKQTEGNLIINGDVSAFLHVEMGLQGDLSALDNIYIFGAIMGFEKSQINKKLDAIIDFSELGDYTHASLRTLSTGMCQRLAFSIAKEADSEILILDEMLAGSDVGFEEKALKVFEEYKVKNQTLIMVSHNMEMVKRFCDKALLLDKGNQVAFGPVDEVVDLYLKKYGK